MFATCVTGLMYVQCNPENNERILHLNACHIRCCSKKEILLFVVIMGFDMETILTNISISCRVELNQDTIKRSRLILQYPIGSVNLVLTEPTITTSRLAIKIYCYLLVRVLNIYISPCIEFVVHCTKNVYSFIRLTPVKFYIQN